MLISGDASSALINNLCDQGGGDNATVTCFYFDSATRKEESSVSVLSSLPKQLVFGQEGIPEELSSACKGRKNCVRAGTPNFHYFKNSMKYLFQKGRVCIDSLGEVREKTGVSCWIQ